jgi:fido (protein-threonine AMPylation protein)
MQDIIKDPFEEYIRQSDPDKRALGYAWYTAIGLQDVDGLKTSDYLRKTAEDNINGHITLADASRLIESYYEETSNDEPDDNKEADIVSMRIARMLAEDAFTFSVPQYISIHKRLFEGIYSHAGKIRDYNISKKEWVLDGDTVRYGNYSELEQLLEYDIRTEKEYTYKYDNISNLIKHLARFISRLWQIHAFGEGNTRTTAVFFIKYLRSVGFDVTNDIFARHSWYFRNALVRANYNNYPAGVSETTEYLELFLRNLLLNEDNELKNRYLHIRWNDVKQDIEETKQDIEPQKQDIEPLKQDIFIPDEIGNKTKQHILTIFYEYGYEKFFGRSEVMHLLGITASPASALIKKMVNAGIIYPIKGKGKRNVTDQGQSEYSDLLCQSDRR